MASFTSPNSAPMRPSSRGADHSTGTSATVRERSPRLSSSSSSPQRKMNSVRPTERLLQKARSVDGHEKEFLQAVEEVLASLSPVLDKTYDPQVDMTGWKKSKYLYNAMARLLEPERVISFQVMWQDDKGETQINRGWRIQMNSALGAYKGGLRFHPTVTQSVLKFLAFEQAFKNALTTLPLGAGKGGSNFDPKGKSDREVYAFCAAFMGELRRHIGPSIDVPAGDIGVGAREIGYLYGHYMRMQNEHGAKGVLTGKAVDFGGSLLRPEATGYGCVYFAEHMARKLLTGPKTTGQNALSPLHGRQCLVSGSGNVAMFAAQKLLQLGAKVLTLSDSAGTLVFGGNGLTEELWTLVNEHKVNKRQPLSSFSLPAGSGAYYPGYKPYNLPSEAFGVMNGGLSNQLLALPCATQNEISENDARHMVKTLHVKLVCEGANMPTSNEAIEKVFKPHKILYGPGKAANAGGVAVSGLEMAQNASLLSWGKEEVDEKLKDIMGKIFLQCTDTATKYGFQAEDLQAGANIAGFLRLANTMEKMGPAV
ncbi:unnamed protein product [Amoebophrya sp. A120]|nr:unnamed protein product [Amoebophrya sp. A120]|eukprot:GSA120T00022597001.1